MLDKRFVEDYKKIKPTDELKTRIFYSVVEAESKREKKTLVSRLRPVLSGALACVLLICCVNVVHLSQLEEGTVSVAYAATGESIAPSSGQSRAYVLAAHDDVYYEYDELENGCKGAEFTFEFEGRTKLSTDCGSLYLKEADGVYKKLGSKTRIEGKVTLFWAMPDGDSVGEARMTVENRSGKMELSLERLEGEYKADLAVAE